MSFATLSAHRAIREPLAAIEEFQPITMLAAEPSLRLTTSGVIRRRRSHNANSVQKKKMAGGGFPPAAAYGLTGD